MLDTVKLAEMFKQATPGELRQAGKILHEAWNTAEQVAKYYFKEGDKVQFLSKHGTIVKGVVFKLKRTRVLIKEDAGMMWTVAPTLLKKQVSK